MKEREVSIIGGALFAVLSLLSASGSVSLGAFRTPNSSGSYLVYNSSLEVLAIIFSAVGMWFMYNAGKSTRRLPRTL